MAIKKIVPKSPDPIIDADRYGGSTLARFAHLNWLIEQINEEIATLSEAIEDIPDSITLQSVTDEGATTTNSIAALSFENSFGEVKPYRSYVANVGAIGSAQPTQNFVNENNFISPFLWTKVGVGEYTATCTIASFSDATTRVFVDLKAFAESTEVGVYTEIIDPLTIGITIHEADGTPIDGFLLDIEIRDY